MGENPLRTLDRFEKAVRDHEMMGSQPPEDWAGIERRYLRAKACMLRKLGLPAADLHKQASRL